MEIEFRNRKCVVAMMGLVVGDALGVPVEFMSRAELKESPMIDMRCKNIYTCGICKSL